MQEDISCTIKAFMRPEKFERCLLHVLSAGLKTIIVGYDGPKEMLKQHKDIIEKYNPNGDIQFLELPFNYGLSATRNAMNKEVNTKYILQLDDDNYAPTNICRLKEFLERHSDYGVISPGWIEKGIYFLPSLNACDFEIINGYLVRTFLMPKQIEAFQDVISLFPFDFVPTNGLFRKEMFEDVTWDERFKIWGEHQDFFLSNKAMGIWKCAVCTSMYIMHDKGGDYKFASNRYGEEQNKSFNYLIEKWNIKGIYPRKAEDGTLFNGNNQFKNTIETNNYKLYKLKSGIVSQGDFQVVDKALIEQPLTEINLLKDIHKGERCIVIGTGPSLNKTDFSLLENEILFGVNTLYRGFDTFGINPEYMCCSDPRIWNVHDENLLQLDSTLILTGGAARMYLERMGTYKFEYKSPVIIPTVGQMWNSKIFQTDVTRGLYNGDTIIIDVGLQLAYWMGFKQVVLIGCDCDYSGIHRWDGLKSEGSESPPCQGNWSRVFPSYEICKKAYEDDGREIINATVKGKLEIFKRKKLKEIILSAV